MTPSPRYDWTLECSTCATTAEAGGLPTVCPSCAQPWLVRYCRAMPPGPAADALAGPAAGHGMWRYRPWLPLVTGEEPVSLGEGGTPLLRLSRTGDQLGFAELWLKDEATNATGSFKARGLAMAVTRAVYGGAESFVVPTAGNAGVALSAYAARAGKRAKIFAPATTPPTILAQIRWFGGDLELLDGHIGDCGKAAIAYADQTGAYPVNTLREPYRIEGKKTMGLELAEQFGWTLPDAVIYPAGGGTGLIGMWLAFRQLLEAGWVQGRLPRLYAVQSAGCAPVVKAFEAGAQQTQAWPEPWTVASGLRVPAPLGGALMLRAIRESGGGALAVTDAELSERARVVSAQEGIDLSPEGGATLAAAAALLKAGAIRPEERVVLFNTGAGWLYRP
ncbi:MAG TPA: threonine synthase [Gemmatimonadales bacterium]|nr:threonine synthase [Gemmatimonadales bacterium]